MPVREPVRASVVEWMEYVDFGDTIVPPEHDLQAAVGPLSPGTAFQLPVVPPTMAALASAGVAEGLATQSTPQTETNQEGIPHEQNKSAQLVSGADPSRTQERQPELPIQAEAVRPDDALREGESPPMEMLLDEPSAAPHTEVSPTMRIPQGITVPQNEIARVAEPETEPEVNPSGRSTEAIEDEEMTGISEMPSIIAPRKEGKRVVKPSAKIVEAHIQRMRKVARNLSKKKSNQRRQLADREKQNDDVMEE